MTFIRYSSVLLALSLSLVTSAIGQTVTLTMDELAPQSANGLTVKGVTFTVAGGTATFNSPDGGIERYV